MVIIPKCQCKGNQKALTFYGQIKCFSFLWENWLHFQHKQESLKTLCAQGQKNQQRNYQALFIMAATFPEERVMYAEQ